MSKILNFYSEIQQPAEQLRHLVSTQHLLAKQCLTAYPLGAEAGPPAVALFSGDLRVEQRSPSQPPLELRQKAYLPCLFFSEEAEKQTLGPCHFIGCFSQLLPVLEA